MLVSGTMRQDGSYDLTKHPFDWSAGVAKVQARTSALRALAWNVQKPF